MVKKKAVAVIRKKRTEIVKMQGNTPADLIRAAVTGGADLDKLEKVLALQERWEANEARKIFALSFATVQERIASVVKTKFNPQTHSKYADLNNIIESAKPIYTREGFSVIFYEGETSVEGCIRICADVLHKAGHKETYHYDMPLDGLGIKGNVNMTKIHAKGSSTSYARRYLMCMIWNIPTQDDDDGVAAGVAFINEEEQGVIADLLIEIDEPLPKFLNAIQFADLDKIPKSKFKEIKDLIAQKKARKNK